MQQARPLISRLLVQQVRKYHHADFKPPSMNELPVPQGSWQARNDANQKKYNAILLFGVAFSAGSIFLAKASGLLYLNFSPPKTLD